MIELPKEKRLATRVNPGFIIIYGKPKSGKTTALSMLDDCLILDLEEGTEFMNALTIPVTDIKQMFEVARSIREAGNPYKYIAFDTASKLEDDIVLPLAKKFYTDTPQGKAWQGDDVKKLPNGAGYLYLREAFKYIIDMFTPLCDTLILSAHCKEKQIEKEGKEMSEFEPDLTGKLSSIISAKAHAIGYVYRDKNKTMINFKGGDNYIVESRAEHLSNKEFILVEKTDKGFIHHWDQIFINT